MFIGFFHAGQEVAIKVDTFNFPRVGLLHGKVISVSQDALLQEKLQNKDDEKKQVGAESESSEPKGQELVYTARISLDQIVMDIDDSMVDLEPGMAVSAEIKTGSRHIIDSRTSYLTGHS